MLIILLDNAIKFTPAHGAVKIRAQLLDKDPNLLVFHVADTGVGIGEGLNEQIFERLFQASDPSQGSRQGLGLGLHICKELVVRQGGRIWANSKPGQGAVFSVTLPVFSMRNLLTPAFKIAVDPKASMTLLVTQVLAPKGWLSDATRAEQSHLARELISRCLHSAQDVLLPKMGSSGLTELFFVVAATGGEGAGLLSRRIQQQFEENEARRATGLTLSTSCHAIEFAAGGMSEPRSATLDGVAARIQVLVNAELSARMVANG